MAKSSRHSKIIGDFGEALILYWLSKDGFECSIVDHTGIDLIARNPHTTKLMGISVKSRSRNCGKERTSLRIDMSHFEKVEAACEAFECEPHMGIVIDAGDRIRVFITSLGHFLEMHAAGNANINWAMSVAKLKQYSEDDQIMCFSFKSDTERWWTESD